MTTTTAAGKGATLRRLAAEFARARRDEDAARVAWRDGWNARPGDRGGRGQYLLTLDFERAHQQKRRVERRILAILDRDWAPAVAVGGDVLIVRWAESGRYLEMLPLGRADDAAEDAAPPLDFSDQYLAAIRRGGHAAADPDGWPDLTIDGDDDGPGDPPATRPDPDDRARAGRAALLGRRERED